ncbi:MAG: LPP20 family lipoprotein [Prevotella sp.]|nr:LPP20 family lipoprotein [Prevotella sp.]
MIITFSLFSILIFSQVNKENEKRACELQASSEYICGLGHGNTLKQASNDALAALSSQISTTVSSDFNYLVNSESNGDDVKESVKVDNIIRTYSHTTLRNAMELVIEDEPNATVLRYIKRSDLDKIFEQRRNKVLEYASNAQKYEKENKVADALSSYYAALALLRSLPDGSDMKIRLGFTEEALLMPLIMKNVNDILNNVEIKTEAIEDDGDERTMIINIQYKGKPATNFNYTYYNGSRRSDICTAKDGTGDISIPKSLSISKLDIQAEYICEDEANYDRELRDVLDNTTPVPFRTAKMKLAKDKEVKAVAANVNTATASVMSAPASSVPSTTMDDSKVSPYLATMQKIELAIRQKSYESIRDCFTAEGYDMFNKLVNYGKAKLLRSPVLQFQESGEEVICRSFPMSFSFSGNRRTFVEDVVFHLTKDGKVCEVAFGLNKPAVDDIMNRGAWSDEARKVMINFLESYKTAYALKRLDYISSIFSNDALIITGSFVKSTGNKEVGPSNIKHVKYTRQTKAQYMKSLKACFASNEYVNIHFADNIIRRSASNPNIYGIQIKQDYYSSSYGDTGYLFLLIDFKDVKAPLIHVRTWQPDKDPNARDGRIGMQDFQL